MVAFLYRMGAGFAGDVNRTHPVSIEADLIHELSPPTAYGQAVLVDPTSQGVRPFAAGDVAIDKAYGIIVRTFPTQQTSAPTGNFAPAALGAATPPLSGVIDVLRSGYIMGKVPVGQTCVKNGAMYIWVGAAGGGHVLGGFETVDAGVDTTPALTNAVFNGIPDADGNVEIQFNV
jgi:hypothetical protein